MKSNIHIIESTTRWQAALRTAIRRAHHRNENDMEWIISSNNDWDDEVADRRHAAILWECHGNNIIDVVKTIASRGANSASSAFVILWAARYAQKERSRLELAIRAAGARCSFDSPRDIDRLLPLLRRISSSCSRADSALAGMIPLPPPFTVPNLTLPPEWFPARRIR